MIEVNIDVLAYGDRNKRKEIGKIQISRLSKAFGRISNDYEYKLYDESNELFFSGKLVDSYNTDAFELISQCLNCWKDGWLVSPDNHGLNGVSIHDKQEDC